MKIINNILMFLPKILIDITTILAITIPVGAAIVIGIVLAIVLIVKKKKRGVKVVQKEVSEGVYEYLGGKENVESFSLNGSRLTIVLKDQTKLNKDGLKKEGVSRVLEMSNKIILVGETIPSFYKLLSK